VRWCGKPVVQSEEGLGRGNSMPRRRQQPRRQSRVEVGKAAFFELHDRLATAAHTYAHDASRAE